MAILVEKVSEDGVHVVDIWELDTGKEWRWECDDCEKMVGNFGDRNDCFEDAVAHLKAQHPTGW